MGAGQPVGETEKQRHPPKPGRREQRKKWRRGRGGLAGSGSAGPCKRVFPSLPDSQALGLGLWVPAGGGGGGSCGGLGQRQIGSEHQEEGRCGWPG